MLGIVFAIVAGYAPQPAVSSARTVPASWLAFEFAWTDISAYRATVSIFERKGARTQREVVDYTFSKPANATMHIVEGPNAGATLTWNGGSTVVAHRGSGLMAMFTKTFGISDPRVTTIRGSSINELSFGAILVHAHDTDGSVTRTDGPRIDDVATDEVSLIPTNSIINTGLTLEVVDLSQVTGLPIRVLGYQGPTLVREIDFSNVVLNP